MHTTTRPSRPGRSLAAVALATLLLLVLTATGALAHVTVRADTTEPGGFAKYTIRVPNESDTAGTTSVEVEMPEGYEEARIRPLEGWDIALTDGVLTISGGLIDVGQFQEFEFSARNPEEASTVVFPAIQTYDDGEESAWTGEEDSDRPAPVVEVVATEAAGDDGTEPSTEAPVDDTATEAADEATSDDGETDALTIVALIAGLLGLVLGGVALATSRRRA